MNQVPDDCLIQIFHFLPKCNLLQSVGAVSNEWRHFSMHHTLWKDYAWNKKSIQFIYSYCKYYGPWLSCLSLNSCYLITNSVLHTMMTHLEGLQELHLKNCDSIHSIKIGMDEQVEEETGESSAVTPLPLSIPRRVFCQIRSLSLVRTPLQIDDLRNLLTCCAPVLEELKLERTLFKISDLFRHRKTSIHDSPPYIELPCLKRLTIGGYTKKVSRPDVEILVSHACPNLEELVLDKSMFDQGRLFHMLESLRRFKKLQVLRITQSETEFHLSSFEFFQYLPTHLKELTIETICFSVENDALAQFLQKCSDLETLRFTHLYHGNQHHIFSDYAGFLTCILLNAPKTLNELCLTRRYQDNNRNLHHVPVISSDSEIQKYTQQLESFDPPYKLRMIQGTRDESSLSSILRLEKFNKYLPKEIRHQYLGGSEYLY